MAINGNPSSTPAQTYAGPPPQQTNAGPTRHAAPHQPTDHVGYSTQEPLVYLQQGQAHQGHDIPAAEQAHAPRPSSAQAIPPQFGQKEGLDATEMHHENEETGDWSHGSGG